VDVTVIQRGKHLMNQQLDQQAATILKSTMEKMNVGVLLGKNTKTVLGEDRVTGLKFDDGSILSCDMVVIATGIKPNSEIGARCGLTVERAIVVDNHMRSTDDPNIYVVGECAQHRGFVYGLVAPLWEQAKVLADHITGHNPNAAYHGSKVATKLKVMGVEMAAMGETEPSDERDEIVQFTEPKKGTYKKLIIRDGRLVGGILLGDISKAAYLMQAFDRGMPLPEERLTLLFDLGAPSKKVTMDELPLDAQMCNCNGVSKGVIVQCVKDGKRSPRR
jgi:nitrite reductase (NADH) large subunit